MKKITLKLNTPGDIGFAMKTLHLKMVENNTPLTIVFPEYDKSIPMIGSKVIILGSNTELLALNLVNNDSYRVGALSEISESDIRYSYKRKHEVLNSSKIRRIIKRANSRGDDVSLSSLRRKMMNGTLSLPFISILSESTKQHFKIFIEEVDFEKKKPSFYGLAK